MYKDLDRSHVEHPFLFSAAFAALALLLVGLTLMGLLRRRQL